ncbi:nucleolar protein 58 [Nilaparvata lugens]|uniref:nucleolar protein 58 n=1 Tax=Nilaparvata lugens TaxID=108931 RepID=UPI000B985A7A|nr:nucleolar protein 58 [Nilaparvata lugens]
MLVLFETPAGYAFFKLLDKKAIEKTDNLYKDFATPEQASKIVKLKHFESFANTAEALEATTAVLEGKVTKKLRKVLKKVLGDATDELLVSDAKLGGAIKEKLNLSCVTNTAVSELMRCIRSQTDALLAETEKKDLSAMKLGLAHSLSRYKLKFSADKVDTMIVQAICLLDELDKELNNYIMRCREWYGWHFPELGKIITDNLAFVKVVKLIGTRENVKNTDLSDILPDDIEEQVKAAAEISMGTEIADDDIVNIQNLCDQVIEISSYRTELYEYLKARMMAIAPNLTVLMGELIGARLISQAGSLINLAKHPASTVQILGAEKALFRALKTKKDTPKYGLIYHSQIVAQSSAKNKGKASRMLAAKAALASRVDALGEGTSMDLGTEHRAKLETRLRLLEEGNLRRISGTAKAKAKFEKYHGKSEVKQYPSAADSTMGKRKLIEDITPDAPKKKKIKTESGEEVEIKQEEEEGEQRPGGEESAKKKKKKKKSLSEEGAIDASVEVEPVQEEGGSPKKKKKKNKKIKEEPTE